MAWELFEVEIKALVLEDRFCAGVFCAGVFCAGVFCAGGGVVVACG